MTSSAGSTAPARRWRASRCCSRTTSTPATRCRPRPARSRWSDARRRATRSWCSGCGRPARSILGKANLSEWANFRSHALLQRLERASAARPTTRTCWTATRAARRSGSAVAVAANLATVAIGTETDGSIVCPSGQNGVVGIKPTLGLVSRAGIVPISAQQDTAGPMARNVADAALTCSRARGRRPGRPGDRRRRARSSTRLPRRLDPNALRASGSASGARHRRESPARGRDGRRDRRPQAARRHRRRPADLPFWTRSARPSSPRCWSSSSTTSTRTWPPGRVRTRRRWPV